MRVRSSHALRRAFPDPSTSSDRTTLWSYNPEYAVTYPVWALSLSLATTQEIILIFFSCAYLDVSVRRVRVVKRHVFNMPGFPIRKSPDLISFADPRRLSQLITSFIASESLGIPRVPFLTFFSPYPFAVRGCFSVMSLPRRKETSLLLSSLVFFLPICQRTFSGVLSSKSYVLSIPPQWPSLITYNL